MAVLHEDRVPRRIFVLEQFDIHRSRTDDLGYHVLSDIQSDAFCVSGSCILDCSSPRPVVRESADIGFGNISEMTPTGFT